MSRRHERSRTNRAVDFLAMLVRRDEWRAELPATGNHRADPQTAEYTALPAPASANTC